MWYVQGNFPQPPSIATSFAAVCGGESSGCLSGPPGFTFTCGWGSFKLKMGAQLAGQDFISNQCKARQTSVPHDVTCRQKEKTS